MKKENVYVSKSNSLFQKTLNLILRKKGLIGPCGPCSFINMTGIKGNPKLESELAEIGRLKPFYASDFTSFLIWAEKYGINLIVFTEKTEVTEGAFEMMFEYENIPLEQRKQKKIECIKRHSELIKKNKNKIKKLTNIIETIDTLLQERYSIAYNMGVYDIDKKTKEEKIIGHLRVIYKKEGEKYFIKDSDNTLKINDFQIGKKDLVKDIELSRKIGQSMFIVAFKKEN